MTRPRGTVPIKISRRRAEALAAVVAAAVIDEPTVLGRAGLTDEQVRAWQLERRFHLDSLAQALLSAPRGRPRSAVSLYYLPREGIAEFKRTVPKVLVPRRLHPLVRKLVSAIARRRGPPTYTGAALDRRIETGLGDDSHLRQLKRRLRLEVEHARWIRKIEADRDATPERIPSYTQLPAGVRALLVMSDRF